MFTGFPCSAEEALALDWWVYGGRADVGTDVVVPVGAVVKDFNSLGDTSVPASIVAWFRIGRVSILVVARVRA